MIMRVKTKAEADKLAGRAPQAAPAPAPPPKAAAPAPAPAPAAPVIDTEARALIRASADTAKATAEAVRQLTALVAQTVQQPAPQPIAPQAPAPAPVAPPAPAPEPAPAPAPRFIGMPLRAPGEAVPAPAAPAPAPKPKPSGPIEAVVARDKKDRLLAVTITSSTPLAAIVQRDKQDRMSTITVERDGKKITCTIHRDSKKRIEKMTIANKERHDDHV